jgi:hypothetical protein
MKTCLGGVTFLTLLAWLGVCQIGGADPLILWGTFNAYDGDTALTNVPANATNLIALAAGDAHCVALKADGTVVAWGGDENNAGATNVPAGLTNVVSVAAGSTHSLALRRDGSLAAWGQIFDAFTSIGVPPQATNIVALALGPGAEHAFVLKADGTVFDWVYTYTTNLSAFEWFYTSYTTNIPAMARDIVAVAAGATYCLALRADGSVVTWGNGATTPVSGTATNIVAIATGWSQSVGLRADGTVIILGQNTPNPIFNNIVDLANDGMGNVIAQQGNGNLQVWGGFLPTYPAKKITAIAVGGYADFALVGSGPPMFPGLPVNRTVAAGSRAYFRAVASGAMPINYQWNCNGTNVPGATNNVLTLTNVQPALAGNYYSLMASNSLGMITNGAMFLNVLPLEFAIQPPALSAAVGATATFTLAFTNGVGPFSWQWSCNNTNLAGATNSSLSLTNVQMSQAGTYALVVSNSYGSVTNTAVLTVLPLVFNAGTTNLVMTTNGLQLELDAVYATNSVVIYASTDLVSWLPIFTNPPSTNSVRFLDAAATNAPQRFYRALEQ